MNELMTGHFAKWAAKQKIPENELITVLSEIQAGIFEANLGGHLFKKRLRFKGQGKSGSGRAIICYQKDNLAIFIHDFAKNEKNNLSVKELRAFKEFAKILLNLSAENMAAAIENEDFVQVEVK